MINHWDQVKSDKIHKLRRNLYLKRNHLTKNLFKNNIKWLKRNRIMWKVLNKLLIIVIKVKIKIQIMIKRNHKFNKKINKKLKIITIMKKINQLVNLRKKLTIYNRKIK